MTFLPAFWDGGQTADTLDVASLTKGQMMPDKRRFPCVEVAAPIAAGVRRLTALSHTQGLDAQPSATAWPDPLRRRVGHAVEGISTGVRRLTPTECERLQGLPDGWTIPGSDSKRYAGLGDAVTANVAEWIARRLIAAEEAS